MCEMWSKYTGSCTLERVELTFPLKLACSYRIFAGRYTAGSMPLPVCDAPGPRDAQPFPS